MSSKSSSKGKKSLPPKRSAPTAEEETEDEYVSSDLEEELEMPAKDDTVRSKKSNPTQRRPSRIASHGVTGLEEDGEDLAEKKERETGKKIAPHVQIIQAATYHLGISAITRPAISNYIPSCRNMFQMVHAMMQLVSENTCLIETSPGFTSFGFYCYCGLLYFYQILRAKDAVGQNQLSREERRALRSLKSIGEPEAWPVPSPLVEFIRALGYYKSSNPQFSFVVPKFPSFTNVSRQTGGAGTGIARLDLVSGIQRVPPVCAYIEFLRKFGNGLASFNETYGWIPNDQVALAVGHSFIGLTNSGVNGNAFKALVFADGWIKPTEGDMTGSPTQLDIRQRTVRRWNLPDYSALDISDIETFIGVKDTLEPAWMKQLLKVANDVCRFFPKSTTLSNIDPICHIGTLTFVKLDKTVARTFAVNQWYASQVDYKLEYHGYDDTEQGRMLIRIGIATGTLNIPTIHVIPTGTIGDSRTGPFFADDADAARYERHERYLVNGSNLIDVTARFAEQLARMYDATGESSE